MWFIISLKHGQGRKRVEIGIIIQRKKLKCEQLDKLKCPERREGRHCIRSHPPPISSSPKIQSKRRSWKLPRIIKNFSRAKFSLKFTGTSDNECPHRILRKNQWGNPWNRKFCSTITATRTLLRFLPAAEGRRPAKPSTIHGELDGGHLFSLGPIFTHLTP